MTGPFRYPSGPLGVACGALLACLAIFVLLPQRDNLNPATPALVLIVPGVIAAILGGRIAASAVSAAAAIAFGVLFLPPFGRWKLLDAEDVTAVVVFVLVAVTVGDLTAREGARRRQAEARTSELEDLTESLELAHVEKQRLNVELDKLAVMAEVDEQRSALLRSVSHDLRTPLATIRAVSRRGWTGFLTWCGWAGSGIAASTSCRAVNSSAWPSRARWCSSLICCCWTNHWPPLTANCAKRCSWSFAASSASLALPRSTSPTTSARRWWYRTRSS